ncbi:MAG: alpha/beta hydrolase [Phycisphaeraceae bacterium]
MRMLIASCTLLCFAASLHAAPKDVAIPGGDQVKKTTQVYKKVGDVELKMFIVTPADHKATDKRPAIIFFFGGGWTGGSTGQFEKQSEYFAARGMVTMAADYRVKSRQNVTPDKCVMDAKSAIRWARANAGKLGIDPDRIVAAGGSAGGHIAAATGTVPGYEEEGEDVKISSVPNAMVLFNPVLNTTVPGWGDEKKGAGIVARFGDHAEKLSPEHHVKKGTPATLVIHGKADSTVPFAQAENFAKAMKAAGNRCDVAAFDGQGHGFFNYGRGDNAMFVKTTVAADKFLASIGYLKGEATLVAQK